MEDGRFRTVGELDEVVKVSTFPSGSVTVTVLLRGAHFKVIDCREVEIPCPIDVKLALKSGAQILLVIPLVCWASDWYIDPYQPKIN